jgi:hypothetical protein
MARPDPRCVIDRSRPCNACVAANPQECPYPFLLGDDAGPRLPRSGRATDSQA